MNNIIMDIKIRKLLLHSLIEQGLVIEKGDISVEYLENILKDNGMRCKKEVSAVKTNVGLKKKYINNKNQTRVVTQLNDFKEYIMEKYKIESNSIAKELLETYKNKEKYNELYDDERAPWNNYIDKTFKIIT